MKINLLTTVISVVNDWVLSPGSPLLPKEKHYIALRLCHIERVCTVLANDMLIADSLVMPAWRNQCYILSKSYTKIPMFQKLNWLTWRYVLL